MIPRRGEVRVKYPNVPDDTERMFRPKPRPRILSVSQHWRIVDGTSYRDCLVQLPNGTRRLMGVRDELLRGVA